MPISAVCRLLLVLAATTPLHAQSTVDELQTRLLSKPLYLRGFWKSDKLAFDSTGKLQGDSETLPFTLSGIEITKVDLEPKTLILEGLRVAIVFDRYTPQRIVLQAGSPESKHDEQMHIEIEAPPGGDYASVLDAIFTDDLASFVPSLPTAWQNYASKNLLHGSPSSDPKTEQPARPPGMKRIGGGVLPPRVLQTVEPQFDEYARATKIAGRCLISLVVGSDGTLSQLSIVRPAGAGLDEKALEAVQRYVFSPATEDGKPVAVAVNIEVNFQIF